MNHSKDEYKNVNPDILYKLEHFSYETHFRKEIYKILVDNVKEKDIQHLRKQFNLIDFEHNGYINYEEEKRILKAFGRKLTI